MTKRSLEIQLTNLQEGTDAHYETYRRNHEQLLKLLAKSYLWWREASEQSGYLETLYKKREIGFRPSDSNVPNFEPHKHAKGVYSEGGCNLELHALPRTRQVLVLVCGHALPLCPCGMNSQGRIIKSAIHNETFQPFESGCRFQWSFLTLTYFHVETTIFHENIMRKFMSWALANRQKL